MHDLPPPIENSQSISHIPSTISVPHLLFIWCTLVSKGPYSTKRACVFSMGGTNWNPAGIKPLLLILPLSHFFAKPCNPKSEGPFSTVSKNALVD